MTIKHKHLPTIEQEAEAGLKQNTKKYYTKKQRETFQLRVSKTFKAQLKNESRLKEIPMSKVMDDILTLRFTRMNTLSEIDYQNKIADNKIKELNKKLSKIQEMERQYNETIYGETTINI